MAGRFEGKGIIGNSDNMKPNMIWQTKERNGKQVKVPFITFRMWTDDFTKAMITTDDGQKRRSRDVVQVILPEDQRGQNLFKRLAAGRRVLVRGRLTYRPNAIQGKENESMFFLDETGDKVWVNVYANPVVYLDSLEFLDEPLEQISYRVLNILQAECELINDEQKTQFLAALKEYEATLRKTNEDRVIKNSIHQENVTAKSDDPDSIPFN